MLPLTLSLLPIGLAARADAQVRPRLDACSNIDPTTQRECIGRRIESKEQRMRQLYVRALVAVRRSFSRYGRQDNRTSPAFLQRSQESWQRFVDSNCTVTAAFGGGSNSAISNRETECYEAELDRRIEFLRQIAEGGGVFAL